VDLEDIVPESSDRCCLSGEGFLPFFSFRLPACLPFGEQLMSSSIVVVVGASDDAFARLEQQETTATVLRFAHALAAVAAAMKSLNVIVMGPNVWAEERSMLTDLAARSGARLVRLAA